MRICVPSGRTSSRSGWPLSSARSGSPASALGEAPRVRADAVAGPAEQQVGVRWAAQGGAQTRPRCFVADQAREGVVAHRPRASRTRAAISSASPLPSTWTRPPFCREHVLVGGDHPAVEVERLSLDAIVVLPIAARGRLLGADGQEHRRVRHQPARADVVDGAHRLGAHAPHHALVDERAPDVAVGDHGRAALQRRRDHVLDELGAGCGEEQRLGPRADRLRCPPARSRARSRPSGCRRARAPRPRRRPARAGARRAVVPAWSSPRRRPLRTQ